MRTRIGSTRRRRATSRRRSHELWKELLKVDQVGRYDNFFDLGGHSLLAVTLIARMREQGLQTAVHAFFSTPTLKDLAAQVRSRRRGRRRLYRIGSLRAANTSRPRCCR